MVQVRNRCGLHDIALTIVVHGIGHGRDTAANASANAALLKFGAPADPTGRHRPSANSRWPRHVIHSSLLPHFFQSIIKLI